MFGFGNQPPNGFGTTPPPAPPPAPFAFGSAAQPNNTGFPSPPFSTPGFAAATPVVFNSTSTAPIFGSSPNVNGFGSGTSTFAQGVTPAAAAPMFGQSSSLSAPLPAGTTNTAFATSNTIAPAFNGGNTGNTTGFVASAPFGTTNPPPFVSQPPTTGPFGGPPAPAVNSPFNPFAPSSNQTSNAAPQFAQSSNVSAWPTSRTGPSHSYGTSTAPSAAPPFGMPTSVGYDDGMMDDAPPPPSNLVFGRPVSSIPDAPKSRTGWDTGAAESDDSAPQTNTDELLKLQAKIEAKKKQFALQKQLRDAAAATATSTLRPDAPSFQPAPTDALESNLTAVAQRNAVRFSDAANPTTRSHLPLDLLSQSAEVTAAQTALRNAGGRSERENLEHAVSLVGTCEHMCPDEELLRREREGDIQLLERCAPGVLHPPSWTLRNTMVKRFRRSAADYKLDVPEWVRPPDVLEKVCGYLEEWVMERDRQGDDPRYKAPPPPLDVYQYVWDRTRMVRKDFILQNYVGNGGKCDARAVRCHERIARWHTMCEHQLSHLSDFITQSQQNVQELGQTMKTLNQFYDDSMGRALVEVPDDEGRETRLDLSSTQHGCQSATVQGPAPVEYDGTKLNNNADRENDRLTGKHAVHSPNHGTAEPEMRGLYILLTMGNDGGMEVLKYAARLYQERPEVYHTTPVQLALAIFKAKTDKNYARFFSILRSPSTPYLFACLMFKHVESMRKAAFRICSKTYGAVGKDGTTIYDTYPLQQLTELLCFENDGETRSACQHYSITVLDETEGSFISWKGSSFREPRDDDKATAIPLRPFKMLRTIESKLKGATRVAVCRGEVSGEGSCLSEVQLQLRFDRSKNLTSRDAAREILLAQQERAEKNRQRDEQRRLELEDKQRAHREKVKRDDELKQMQQRIQQERQQKERERVEQERLERDRQAQQKALEQAAALKRAEDEERQRKIEVERQEMLRREREAKIQAEEERKRLEKEELARLAAEAERKKLEYEAEVRRQAEKRKRQEILRQEELKRQLREAEERQRQQDLMNRVKAAQRTLVWRRIMYKTVRVDVANSTQSSLASLSTMRLFHNLSVLPTSIKSNHVAAEIASSNRLDVRQSLETFLQTPFEEDENLKLSEAVVKSLRMGLEELYPPSTLRGMATKTFLYKVAIVLPRPSDRYEHCMCGLVRSWLQTQLVVREVVTATSEFLDARVVFVFKTESSNSSDCDAALLVVPPPWSDHFNARHDELTALSALIDESIPRVVLSLSENFDGNMSVRRNKAMTNILAGNFDKLTVVDNDDLDVTTLNRNLSKCMECLVESMVNAIPKQIERWSISRVYLECFDSVMRNGGELERKEDVAKLTQTAIRSVMGEVEATWDSVLQSGYPWPSREFGELDIDDCVVVPDYFGKGFNLPLDWAAVPSRYDAGLRRETCDGLFDGSFSETVERLVFDAPLEVRAKCQTLLDEGDSHMGLRTALIWRVHSDEMLVSCEYVFLPAGQLRLILDRVCPQVDLSYSRTNATDGGGHLCRFSEQIDRPPGQTPVNSGKRTSSATVPLQYVLDEAQHQQTSPTQSKRQRLNVRPQRKRTVSNDTSASAAFTKRLERLYHGVEINDMFLGNGSTLLSDALLGAPALKVKHAT